MAKVADNGSKASQNNQGRERIGLAALIILPAFILIGYMLTLQSATNDIANRALINAESNSGNITAATALYKEVQQANQNLFSILLSVFGAWVGAVVAYFFGAQSAQKIQDSNSQIVNELQKAHSKDMIDAHDLVEKAMTKQDKLSRKTIAELLEKNPDSKNVVTAKIDSEMNKLTELFNDPKNIVSNVVILKNGKPIGVLFAANYFKAFEAAVRDGNNTFEFELRRNPPNDIVTGTPWTENGVKNFAGLSMTDSLLSASEKMRAISDSPAVRGIVLAENGEPIAIINHEMINAEA